MELKMNSLSRERRMVASWGEDDTTCDLLVLLLMLCSLVVGVAMVPVISQDCNCKTERRDVGWGWFATAVIFHSGGELIRCHGPSG